MGDMNEELQRKLAVHHRVKSMPDLGVECRVCSYLKNKNNRSTLKCTHF